MKLARLSRVTGTVAALACTLARAPSASADAPEAPALAAPPEPDRPTNEKKEDRVDPFRLGLLAGVGFPRPIALEVMTKLGGVVGLGVEGSFLPSLSVSGVDAAVGSLSGDLRVFPFRGAFFLGLRGGYQHIGATATIRVPAVGSATEAAALDSVYLNPRLGFLWTLRSGFTVGIEAGVQVPVSTSFTTTLPGAIALEVRQNAAVATLSGVLPTVDLLRIGMLF